MYLYTAPRNGSSALDGGKLYLTGSIQSRDQVCFCLGLNPAVSSFMQAEVLFVKQNFAVIILGSTWQVGGAAVAELLAVPECREVVMVTRKPIAPRSRISKYSGRISRRDRNATKDGFVLFSILKWALP